LDELNETDNTGFACWAAGRLISQVHDLYPGVALLVEAADRLDPLRVRSLQAFSRVCTDALVSMTWSSARGLPFPYGDLSATRNAIIRAGFVETPATPDEPELGSGTLRKLSRSLFRREGAALESSAGFRVFGMPEGDAEAAVVAGTVTRWIRAGDEPENILVVFPEWTKLAQQVREKLNEQGVACEGLPANLLSNDSAVRVLLLCMKLLEHDWDKRLLGQLLRQTALCPDWPEVVGPHELWRAAAVLPGLSVSRGLVSLEFALKAQVERRVVAAKTSRGARARRALDDAELASKVITHLSECLQVLDEVAPWSAHCCQLERLSKTLLGPAGGQNLAVRVLFCALEQQGAVLNRLEAPGKLWQSRWFFSRVRQVAEETRLDAPQSHFGSVKFATIDEFGGSDWTHGVFAGLSDGTMPTRERFDISTHVTNFQGNAPWDAAAKRLAEQMRALIGFVGGFNDELVLVYPTTDSKGEALSPFGFLRNVKSCFTSRGWAECHVSRAQVEPGTIPEHLVLEREGRLATLLGQTQTADTKLLRASAATERGHESLIGVATSLRVDRRRRRKGPFGGFDGMLREKFVGAALDRKLNPRQFKLHASELQLYVDCPFRFFQKVILELNALAERDEFTDDARALGREVHHVLQNVHTFLRTLDYEIDGFGEHVAEELARVIAAKDQGSAEPEGPADQGRREYDRARQLRLLRRFVSQLTSYIAREPTARLSDIAQEIAQTDDRNQFLEVGEEGDAGPLLALKGTIDRVDRIGDGENAALRLIDYKTGEAVTKSEIARGVEVTLPVLMLLLEQQVGTKDGELPLEGGIWSLKQKGFVQALKLGGAGSGVDWKDLRPKFVEYLEGLARNIRNGAYPVSPRETTCERYCEYRAVCRIRQLRGLAKTHPGAVKLGVVGDEVATE
jgi:RecB family exonuclease